MKNFKIDSSITYIFFFIFVLQTILIAHRSSFSPSLIFNFYKENVGLEEGIKNKRIIDILEIIKKNNLTSFKLEDHFLKSGRVKQRVFEGAYPTRYKKNSIYLITNHNVKENCTPKDKINNIYLLNCE